MHAPVPYHFLTTSDFTLPYREFGEGPELLLAFHGFGRSGADFLPFEEALREKYTIIAFDFFYHGPHAIDPAQEIPSFTAKIFSEMIEKLLWEKKRVRCSLIGYSQGGRIILGLVHHLPHRIHELFILAPDGMKKNRIRNFIGQTTAGRSIGKWLVKHPKPLFAAIKLLSQMHFISRKVAQFYLLNTHKQEDRYRIYHTWLALKEYNIHNELLHHYFSTRPIRIEFFLGRYDTIITLQSGLRFTAKMQGKIKVNILDCGHDLLQLHEIISISILSNGEPHL